MGIDIGLVNKYYDLAKAGDPLAMEHYKTLEKNAPTASSAATATAAAPSPCARASACRRSAPSWNHGIWYSSNMNDLSLIVKITYRERKLQSDDNANTTD